MIERCLRLFKPALLFPILLGMVGLLGAAPPAQAANPPPVQTFYVTLPEDQLLTYLNAINTAANNPVQTYISLAAVADGTIIYYDPGENGYVPDIANPTPAEIYNATTNKGGVQIWGDGDITNGAPPGVTTNAGDVIHANDVIVLSNAITTTATRTPLTPIVAGTSLRRPNR